MVFQLQAMRDLYSRWTEMMCAFEENNAHFFTRPRGKSKTFKKNQRRGF